MNQIMGESFLRHEITNTEGSVLFCLIKFEPFAAGGVSGPTVWAVAVAATYRGIRYIGNTSTRVDHSTTVPFIHVLSARSHYDATREALAYIDSVGTVHITSTGLAHEGKQATP